MDKTARGQLPSERAVKVGVLASTSPEDRVRIGGAGGFVRSISACLPVSWSLHTPGAGTNDTGFFGSPLGRSWVPARIRYLLRVVWRLRAIAKLDADLLYCQDNEAAFVIALVRRLTGWPKVLLAVHQHGSANALEAPTYGWASRLRLDVVYGRMQRWTYRHVDRVVAIDEQCLEVNRRWGTEQKCTRISNAVDLRRFRPCEYTRSVVRSEIPASEEDCIVLAVGRLEPVKRFHLVIQAIHLLHGAWPGQRFWLFIAGSGSLETELAELASEGPGRGNISLVGALAADDLIRLYQAADVLALPSEMEGVPMVLLEAMAAGLPVVATDVGGVRSIVPEESGIILQKQAEASDLAGAIAAISRWPSRRQKIRAGVSAFASDRVVRELEFDFARCVARRATR